MLRYAPSIIASAAVLMLIYLMFLVFQPFATPLVFAAVMVILFAPLYERINRKVSKFWASLISTMIVLVVIIIPALAIAAGIIQETLALSHTMGPVPVEKIMTQAHIQAAKLGIDLDALINTITQKVVNQAGQFTSILIGHAWDIFMGIVVALLAVFFFFRDSEKILNQLQAFTGRYVWGGSLIREIGLMIKANITASFVAASLQGTIGGLAFAGLGLPAPILWGTVMGFFSIFPFIGSWLVWLPAAVGLWMVDRTWDAIILSIIGLAVVNPVDNILRPAIVASATHLNGLLIFIGLLGGVQAFGIPGLLFGPVLMMTGAGLLQVLSKFERNDVIES